MFALICIKISFVSNLEPPQEKQTQTKRVKMFQAADRIRLPNIYQLIHVSSFAKNVHT